MFASRAVFAAILVAFVSLPAQAEAIDAFSTLDTLSAARCPTVTCTAGKFYHIHLDGAGIYWLMLTPLYCSYCPGPHAVMRRTVAQEGEFSGISLTFRY